jgi:cytoskeleton protein RodZ
MVGVRPSKRAGTTQIGQLLRTARQQRGVTLDAAAAALRIPKRQLAALEECELSDFSAEVYARGAFMKYAAYLGVETLQTQKAFMRALGESREPIPLKLLTPRSWLARVLTPYWLFAMIGGVAALVVGSYVVWQLQSFLRLPDLVVLEPQQAIVQDMDIMVKGKTEQNATVTVNDQPVLIEPDGSFAAPLTLRPGINIVRVEAKNAAERRRIIQKDLLLPRS